MPRYVERGGIIYGIECSNLACGARVETTTSDINAIKMWNKRINDCDDCDDKNYCKLNL